MTPDVSIAVPVGVLSAVMGFTVGYWLSRLFGLREAAQFQVELGALSAQAEKMEGRLLRECNDLRVRLGVDPFHSSYCPCARCTTLAPVGVIKAGSTAAQEVRS
jgi:hypothetical protein